MHFCQDDGVRQVTEEANAIYQEIADTLRSVTVVTNHSSHLCDRRVENYDINDPVRCLT